MGYSRSLKTLADAEDMSVGMAHMHLAHVPGHVSRRPGDIELLLPAVSRNPMPIAAVEYVIFTSPSVMYASGADSS